MLEVAGRIEIKWETHRGGIYPLGWWMPARSLPEKLGCQTTPREGRRVGLCQTLTHTLSRLVRKLGYLKSCVLVKNGWQLLCKELSSTQLAHPEGDLSCLHPEAEWLSGAWQLQRTWARGWATVNIVAQTWSAFSPKHRK